VWTYADSLVLECYLGAEVNDMVLKVFGPLDEVAEKDGDCWHFGMLMYGS